MPDRRSTTFSEFLLYSRVLTQNISYLIDEQVPRYVPLHNLPRLHLRGPLSAGEAIASSRNSSKKPRSWSGNATPH